MIKNESNFECWLAGGGGDGVFLCWFVLFKRAVGVYGCMALPFQQSNVKSFEPANQLKRRKT